MKTFDQLYIGGEWVAPASGDTIDVVSPHDGSAVGTAPAGNADDIAAAVHAARRAFDRGDWPHLPIAERIAVVERLAALYGAGLDEMATLITDENGSPITFSQLGQVGAPLMMLLGFPPLAAAMAWEQTRKGVSGMDFTVRHEPVGVVGAITAWNVPQILIVAKLVPALLAGCTVVAKPAPEAPLDGLVLAEMIHAAGFPPGVVSIVPGGAEVGDALVSHPGVDKISFTGSTAVGRSIGGRCGEQLKRCSLELGGKSAAIVLDDADIDATVAGLRFASFMNNGQACAAQTRVLAPSARYDEVVDALVATAAEMPVGDPHDPATEIGPVVNERQWERVQSYIAIGEFEGAKAVLGGAGLPADLDGGWYVRPTIFTSVHSRMRIAQEEIFGPVVVVIEYEGDDQAVAIANDSDYGLAGSVWTADLDRGRDIARRVRAGTYGINQYGPDPMSPFGGFKASGIGREWGEEGLADYLEVKSIQG
jgi:betaine-aldehyde dehydrogenase